MKKFFYVLGYPLILIYKFFYRQKIKHFFKNVTIEKIDVLTGRDFEQVVELIFKYCGYKTTLTKASSDFGADVIVTKHGLTWVVQTKLYYNHQVGNSSVQQASSAIKYYHANFACVVTNWKFSSQAKTLAKAEGVLLIDRANLVEFLDCVKTGRREKFFSNLKKVMQINNLII